MTRPDSLIAELGRLRGECNQARRRLPKFNPTARTQTPEEAEAAYWIERAASSLQHAAESWDPRPEVEP